MKTKLSTPGGSAKITGKPVGDGRGLHCLHPGKVGATLRRVLPRAALTSDSLLRAYLLGENPPCVAHSTSFIHLFVYSYAVIEHLLCAKHFAEYIDDVSPATQRDTHTFSLHPQLLLHLLFH